MVDRWVEERLNWYAKLGIKRENLRLRPHAKEELAHYAIECCDIDYLFPMGWAELEGIANRGDYDLTQHANFSNKSQDLFSVRIICHRLNLTCWVICFYY